MHTFLPAADAPPKTHNSIHNPREDPRTEVGEEVRVGVRVGPVEFSYYRAHASVEMSTSPGEQSSSD